MSELLPETMAKIAARPIIPIDSLANLSNDDLEAHLRNEHQVTILKTLAEDRDLETPLFEYYRWALDRMSTQPRAIFLRVWELSEHPNLSYRDTPTVANIAVRARVHRRVASTVLGRLNKKDYIERINTTYCVKDRFLASVLLMTHDLESWQRSYLDGSLQTELETALIIYPLKEWGSVKDRCWQRLGTQLPLLLS